MFIRFRRSHLRIKVYIIENVRRAKEAGGGIKQAQVAYLGSVDAHLLLAADSTVERASILARIAFWEAVNPKLKALANRIGGEAGVKRLRMAIHARIPWPMQPERDRLQVLEAEKEAKGWHHTYEWYAGSIARNEKYLADVTARVNAEISADRKDAMKKLAQANMWLKEAADLRRKAG